MSKAVDGAAMLAGAVGMGALAFFDPALVASPFYDKLMASLALGGISMEAGAIASALTSNRGQNITIRQAAAYRQVIRGTQRVGGVEVYRSTTGSHHDQINYVIVLTGHEVECIENLYLDGRQVYWLGSGPGYTVRNGVGFGGVADGNTHTGPDGQHYNFGGTGHSGLYCEARFGDQLSGDVISGLTANDPNWAAVGGRSPYLGGCCYIYFKYEYNPVVFPQDPEIRLTIRGKNNILDPRTGMRGFTNNWALVVNDVLADNSFGLGDDSANQTQLIAAANVCDEQVVVNAIAGGATTESRYCCDFTHDTSLSPGDVLESIIDGAAGRISNIGGEWFLWPAYWQGSSFTFDKSALTGPLEWDAIRSQRTLCNRKRGTFIAPNYPYSVAGNSYDANGWSNGRLQNNFPFAFQPTSFPEYAQDPRHGYGTDALLNDDSGVLGVWSSTTTYNDGDVITYGGSIYKSLVGSNLNNTPSSTSTFWAFAPRFLPETTNFRSVLSLTQAQRVAKIMLMRNRQQGSGTFPMQLAAWQMQPLDVMEFTFPELNMTSKALEIVLVSFGLHEGSENEAPSVRTSFGVQETDASVYAPLLASEELTIYDVQSSPSGSIRTPDAPTGLTAVSNASTALVAADGVTVVPRISLTWTAPTDALSVQIQIQYQKVGDTSWTDAATVDSSITAAFIAGVLAGQSYNVQIRSLRANGAFSDWDQALGVAVSAPNSLQASYSISPQFPLTQPTSTSIAVAAAAATFGSAVKNYAARTLTITAPGSPTWYYVTIADPTQAGESGSPTLTATASTSNSLVGVQGNTYLGAILALPAGGATNILAGGWPAPQTVQVGA